MANNKKKLKAWQIDFINEVAKKFDRFIKANNTGTFEDRADFQDAMDILKDEIVLEAESVEFEASDIIANDSLMKEVFDELNFGGLDDYQKERVVSVLETNGYGVLKLDSMADETRFEELKEKFELTPYCSTLQLF